MSSLRLGKDFQSNIQSGIKDKCPHPGWQLLLLAACMHLGQLRVQGKDAFHRFLWPASFHHVLSMSMLA